MKKLLSLFCVIILLFVLCACNEDSAKAPVKSNTKTVSDVLENGGSETDKGGSSEAKPYKANAKTVSNEKCDIDLTKLNTTVAYSQVSNMWQTPKDYMGKIIKIRGTFKVITDNGRNYYSCNIGDATACCTAFLEFILKDDLKYPDEYPKADTEITVMGEFETYLENGTMFCQLKNATFC